MKTGIQALTSCLLAGMAVYGQSAHQVWVCGIEGSDDCHMVDSSVMGGVRYEDYKVTNPATIEFDPTQRVKELAAIGTSTAAAMCEAPPSFTTPAPTITFQTGSIQARIFYETPVASFDPSEYMDVEFTNFTASNGFASPTFGFRMTRQLALDGSVIPQYIMTVQAGGNGLKNVAGLFADGTGFQIDPPTNSATFTGTMPSSALLREAILGVLTNAQSILSAANFTVTNPAPSGKTLWTANELIALAGQAKPWIAAATNNTIPLGPPFTCVVAASNGYDTCNGSVEIAAFNNMILAQGSEYLGLRTQQSFNVLVNNLRTWAASNAPRIDPAWEASNPFSVTHAKYDLAIPILMLWPTLRADPALSSADRQTIETWIETWLVPAIPVPDFYPNDLGYWADEALMADAIRRSDNATFAFGVQRFYGALNQMRADGSFPLAAGLSACSATYSNTDLIHLISIAEMAATQGYDLYSMSVNGNTLETAIEFLLNAYQNPALLYQYSKAGLGACFEGKPGDPPDFSGFSMPDAGLAWMEPYIARFPFSATAARLRAILGTNVSTTPFPLMLDRIGLNTTCAFRKPYEFQPVNGAQMAIGSGNDQTVAANQAVPSPLTVTVTDNAGKPLAGVLVSFAVAGGSANIVAPAQILTDSTGKAAANVTMGPASGPVTVTAKALGASTAFSLTNPGPAIDNGGVVGIGGSVPAVTSITPGSLFTIYGQNFVPAGTGRKVYPSEIIKGMLPTTLLGVCVSVGGQNAPLLDVFPGQINAVAPAAYPGAVSPNVPFEPGPYLRVTEVSVTTGCGTPNAAQSVPQIVPLTAAAPEFFYFAHNANGQDPVVAVNAVTGVWIGPPALGASFAPAHPGDSVTIFASGFGPTNPPVAPGAVASGATPVTSPFTVTLGNLTLAASDVLYAGATPGEPISQLNIRIPADVAAGNQPLQIVIGGIASPPGAFVPIALP